MSPTITTGVTWPHFFYTVLVALAIYAIARVVQRKLNRGLYLREADGPVRAFIRIFLILINPITVLVLASIFVAIWPLAHGLMLGLFVLFGFHHIRDYVAGKILKLDRDMQQGRPVKTKLANGSITNFGLTALYLQSDEGRSRIGYTTLLKDGYTVDGNSERGGYYRLRIDLKEILENEKKVEMGQLPDHITRKLTLVLVDSPYIKSEFNVSPQVNVDNEWIIEVDVGVHRSKHLDHLVAQLIEAGFSTSILAR